MAELRQFAIEHVAPPLGRQGNALFLSLLERSIRWGKAASTYSGGNVVYLYPCDLDGSNTDTSTTITAYIVSPTDATPAGVTIPSAKVLAYVPFGDNLGMLWPVAQGGTPGFYAKITASHKVAGKNEWLYDADTLTKNDAGVDVDDHYTEDVFDPLTGLVNLSESGNLAVIPVPTGTVVWVTPRTLGDSTVENQFIYEQGIVGAGSSDGDMLFWSAADKAWEDGPAVKGLPASTEQGDLLVGDNAGGWLVLSPPLANGDYLVHFTAGVWTFVSPPDPIAAGNGLFLMGNIMEVAHDPSLTFSMVGGAVTLGVGDLSFIGGVAGVRTVPIPKLTPGGANGSITYTNGLMTGAVDPT